MRNGCISEGKADLIGEARERRQNFTTWGILALAVFVSVGMAEWSKRSAMGEKVVSPQVLERALAIAEKMEDRRSSQPQHAGGWTTAARSEMGSFPSAISQTPTAAGSERAGLQK
jgi:uncharacterized membrane protein